MKRTKPPFRADHVGSLLRPASVKQAREQQARGEISAADLEAVEDREIERVIRKQEEVGLQAITDGEFRRSWWHLDFLWGLDGAERYVMEQGIAFQGMQTRAEGARIVGKIGFSDHPMLEHFKFLEAHASRMPKFTIPAPSALYGRTGRAAVREQACPWLEQFFGELGRAYAKGVRAFADAGCRYLQLDEVFIAMLCDPNYRKSQEGRGDDPQKLAERYADLINAAMSDIPADMTITMHLCRGNYRSTFMGSGGYDPGGRNPVRPHQGARLLHGVRHRAGRRLRAVAAGPQGSDRGARPGDDQDRSAQIQGSDQAADRRGGEVRRARPVVPEPAMRLRLERGRQYPHRGSAMGEAANDRGDRRRGVGIAEDGARTTEGR